MSDDRKEQTEWTTDHMGIGRSLTDGDRAVFLRAVEWVIEEGVKRGRDPSTDTQVRGEVFGDVTGPYHWRAAAVHAPRKCREAFHRGSGGGVVRGFIVTALISIP